jgi:DNA-binding transcriptional LysR family regulator
MFDWNDLKYLIAVARHGSTLAAARALGVNQSTVTRRIAELESRLNFRLFERHPSGYRLTPAGSEVLDAAETVGTAVEEFERQVGRVAHADVLRLSCPEPIAVRLAGSGLLDRFHAKHPAYRIEFVLVDRYLDLSKGEADVALRSGDTDAGLVGRKIADSIWSVYGSRSYIQSRGAPTSIDDLKDHSFVALDENHVGHRLTLWLKAAVPHATYAARSGSVLGMVSATKAGVGLAALPSALGDAEDDLVHVLGPIRELARDWRLLTHPDMRHLGRVQAFFDFVAAEKESFKEVLTGRRDDTRTKR